VVGSKVECLDKLDSGCFTFLKLMLHTISQMLKTRILEFVIILHHLQTSISNQFYIQSTTQIIINQVDSIDFLMSYL
jgi:hypothetical protein